MYLFCIPAGGTNPFPAWKRKLDKDKNIHILDFPGRGSRAREPFIEDMPTLVSDMTETMLKNIPLGESYAIFGYCFGAIIGYEMCKKLKRENKPLPNCFLTFGSAAPDSGYTINEQDRTDTEEFKKIVAQFLSPLAVGSEEKANKAQQAYISAYKKRKVDGSEILLSSVFSDMTDDEEFEMKMVLSLLNNSMIQIEQDDVMLRDYHSGNSNNECLPVKANIIYGNEDSFVEKDKVLLWQECFTESEIFCVPGDHYSIMTAPQPFVDLINKL